MFITCWWPPPGGPGGGGGGREDMWFKKENETHTPTAGLEPVTFTLGGQCAIHCAKRDTLVNYAGALHNMDLCCYFIFTFMEDYLFLHVTWRGGGVDGGAREGERGKKIVGEREEKRARAWVQLKTMKPNS